MKDPFLSALSEKLLPRTSQHVLPAGPDKVGYRPPLNLVAGDAEKSAGRRVRIQITPLVVGDKHGVERVLEQRAQLGFAGPQFRLRDAVHLGQPLVNPHVTQFGVEVRDSGSRAVEDRLQQRAQLIHTNEGFLQTHPPTSAHDARRKFQAEAMTNAEDCQGFRRRRGAQARPDTLRTEGAVTAIQWARDTSC